jgi:glycosyltransferase involved in cell wall biosynthesis
MRLVQELSNICREVTLVPEKQFHPTVTNGLRAFLSTRPRSSIDCWSKPMSQIVQEQLRSYDFDAAIALTTKSAEYLVNARLPKIIDNDNVDTAYFNRLVKIADNPLSKFRRKLTWVKVVRHEGWLVKQFDATAVVSEEDKQELVRLVPSADKRRALHVVSNGVDLSLLDYKGPKPDSKRIIFTGALTYHANLDAANFFCEQILPRIRRQVPNMQFLVTGGYKGVDVGRIISAGATLTDFLDDIRPAITGSAALVVPLRIGGGTRLKILEAMALGVPVVSTSLGAAGIGVRNGETAMLSDDPEEFAKYTVQLITDNELRMNLIANARSHVAANFGWERSVEALENILQSIT